MKNFLLLALLLLGFFLFFDDIENYWKELNIQKELLVLKNFNKDDFVIKTKQLKTQIIEIQKSLETKKDEGIKKTKAIKKALSEAQQALLEFQKSIEKLQTSGENMKKVFQKNGQDD